MSMYHNILKVRYDILRQFDKWSNSDNSSYNEPFLHVYNEHLSALLKIVQDSGEELEGSIFFTDNSLAMINLNTEVVSPQLDQSARQKRRGIALFALSKTRVLEVGFNCGFSSLLMLSSNPNLEVVSVDIGYHSYVQPCARYLKKTFGDRFTLIAGDSREVLPIYLCADNNFDGYHIDGDHSASGVEADLCNILNTAKNNSVICFDDADGENVRNIITLYLLQGKISHIFDPGWQLPSDNQLFVKVNKL